MEELLAKVKLTIEDAYKIIPPTYLEVIDSDGELLATLEKAGDTWQLRVDGEFVGYITE